MGYYSGSGVVTGGGQQNHTLRSFAILGGGSFAVRGKTITTTTVKNGVSLSTAQGEACSDSLTGVCGGSGSLAWAIFDCEGSRKQVSYTQINGSNLYALQIVNETLSAWKSSSTLRNLT